MSTVGGRSAEDATEADPLLAGVRTLAALADRASDSETIFRALARELCVVLDPDEIHIHHLLERDGVDGMALAPGAHVSQQRDRVAIYMFAGEGSLSHLMPRSERPPGVGWVASTGRSFVTEGRRELAATLPHLAAATGASEGAATRVLLLPLNVRARVEAVVLVVYRALIAAAGAAGGHVGAGEPRRADAVEGDLERAAALVDQAGAALALVHARAEAGTDPVTGCMNHRAMRRRLHEEIGRSQRSRGMLACLLLDLDDFKQINDLHGHPAGDAVLREVARALMGEFRAFDRVARYGGDEFVAILPEADLASAAAAADRALQRLRGITLPFTPQGVAASVGVAQWRTPMGVDDLLSACDEALLRGKREGKGRVTPTLRDC